jgi:hypothetical protein
MTAWSSRADGQNTARELRRFGATRLFSQRRRPHRRFRSRPGGWVEIIRLREEIGRRIVDR